MISVETARRLKEAGLKWNPWVGDSFYDPDEPDRTHNVVCDCLLEERVQWRWDECVWLPRLDQLLTEISERGYFLSLHSVNEDYWDCELYKVGCVYSVDGIAEPKTPEEAAAQALLWVLEREQSGVNSEGN